jgi:peptidoglycan/LPS O-acetylase OafA/YrhL
MNITESVNRTVNLLGTAVAALAGFAFAPEAIIEPDAIDKVDDTLIFLIGIGAIVWYLRNGNRTVRSIMPIVFVGAGFLLKIFAIIVEFADPEDVGDDFGGLILFALATAFLIYEYTMAPKKAGMA